MNVLVWYSRSIMMNAYSLFHGPSLGVVGMGFGLFALLVLIWSFVWKGWALWLAARRGEKVWFIVMLLVNTFGILEIIYIFALAKQSDKPGMPAPKPHDHAAHDHAAHAHHDHEHHDHTHEGEPMA